MVDLRSQGYYTQIYHVVNMELRKFSTFLQGGVFVTLKDKVENLCRDRGISVRQLEKIAGLKDRTIQHWDKSEPSGQKIYSVAKALNVPIEELLSVYSPDLERVAYVQKLQMELEELKKSSAVLSAEESSLIQLFRKADAHDRIVIFQILSRYQEDTTSAAG